MPLSAVVRDRCRALLPPGAEIRFLFPATSPGVNVAASLLFAPYVIFAVTDANIVLIGTSWRNRDQPKKIVATYPRRVRFGDVDTNTIPWFKFAGQLFEVDDEYVSVVRSIDAELVGDLPADPLPDL